MTANLDDAEYTITATLIEAVGRSSRDQDLALVIEKYGLGKLAAALTYAIPYVDHGMGERVSACELGVQPAFGIAILQALRDVVLDMQEVDLYFERLQDAHEHLPAENQPE
ncbi:hypothetical protein GWG54_19240 [Natronococcus sp. JC468]|nr:hypothetical protein [Natronococcus sp. JC468]NKE37892.1 hypothetical protein [Natronococcus sp. JC468]